MAMGSVEDTSSRWKWGGCVRLVGCDLQSVLPGKCSMLAQKQIGSGIMDVCLSDRVCLLSFLLTGYDVSNHSHVDKATRSKQLSAPVTVSNCSRSIERLA